MLDKTSSFLPSPVGNLNVNSIFPLLVSIWLISVPGENRTWSIAVCRSLISIDGRFSVALIKRTRMSQLIKLKCSQPWKRIILYLTWIARPNILFWLVNSATISKLMQTYLDEISTPWKPVISPRPSPHECMNPVQKTMSHYFQEICNDNQIRRLEQRQSTRSS